MSLVQPVARSRASADASGRRGRATRELILDTAERMICERGPDAVSMRQLAAAVGQGNNSAIQYYFESKEGLVRAIIARRAAQLEAIRKTMLADAIAQGSANDAKVLLAVLFLPIAMIKDADGRHVYAGFMLRALHSIWGEQAHLTHQAWMRAGPVREVMDTLCALRPDLSGAQLASRVLRLNRMFSSALVDWDHMRELAGEHDDEAFLLEDLMAMVAAAFAAPLPGPGKS